METNSFSTARLRVDFSKGAFAKTHEAGKFATFFKSKKFTPERWEDKQKLIDKYNEYGFRDAQILEDSVSNFDEKAC